MDFFEPISMYGIDAFVPPVRVVNVESKRVDASGSVSTKVLSNKSDVDNFAKNVFRAFLSDVSCHAKL